MPCHIVVSNQSRMHGCVSLHNPLRYLQNNIDHMVYLLSLLNHDHVIAQYWCSSEMKINRFYDNQFVFNFSDFQVSCAVELSLHLI